MYAPYLYGRRGELTAIRRMATLLGTPQQIFPLVEPVVQDAAPLKGALGDLEAAGAALYLVVNPHRGKLTNVTHQQQWAGAFSESIAKPDLVRPVLLETAVTTPADVEAFVSGYTGRKIALALTSNRLAPDAVAAAISGADAVIFLLPSANPVPYSMSTVASSLILVRDNFQPEARNADYAGEQPLATNHLDYVTSGQPGFSDYTILSSQLSFTGGRAGAVAIHLTYKVDDSSFWIQHFVSDETDQNVGNNSTKLLEAITHLAEQIQATPDRFAQSTAIANYQHQLITGSATNLEGNKRLQIMHHLFTVGVHLGV